MEASELNPVEGMLVAVYRAAELAIAAKKFAESCKDGGAPEPILELVGEVAFRAMLELQLRVADLDQVAFPPPGRRPHLPGEPGLN
jgi:hypothetical protein